ncbi:dihydroxy-acid dehydratase [Elioraea sp.]|uniref:dihydroxy-acid dehydratase n=1 Tax=Elioraea sp. TaxID=2185103 RepID=UPI0025BC5C54|nr:dihydroxy-acid dehydratase [Elioraea sp.]
MTDDPKGHDPKGLARNTSNYGDRDFALYLRRTFMLSMGWSREALTRPTVGICDTGSGLNNCHRHFPDLVRSAERGILASGGLPLQFPTVSVCEPSLSPCSMYYRNLAAIDTEEMMRAQPLDAVVLLGGCDKTVPAQLMAAVSANVPCVLVVGGPMMAMRFEGERLSACTDCRRFWARFRAGDVDAARIERVEGNLATTAGSCGVMGTASTMACIAEVLGFTLPGTAAIPAVHADRMRAAEASGALAVRLATEKSIVRPRELVTPESVENALRVLLALGGSTNAIVHLAAIAGRAGITLDLHRLNVLSDETPVLVDLKPTGQGYMEDFHAAGAMGAVLRQLRPLLHLDVPTVTGETLRERLDREEDAFVDHSVIRPASDPISPVGGLVALFGSLAPNGAILKRSAADATLFEKEARAVVFSSLPDMAERIDSGDLDVTADDMLVLQNAGPKGGYGMPEAGYLPIPKKLARAGLKDMVRISDARMSGTAFGTIVLHVAPESAEGGPLALVRTGDRIRLSVKERRIDLLVAEDELARRRAAWVPPAPALRGWDKLWQREVLQAPEGVDFAFLRPEGQ